MSLFVLVSALLLPSQVTDCWLRLFRSCDSSNSCIERANACASASSSVIPPCTVCRWFDWFLDWLFKGAFLCVRKIYHMVYLSCQIIVNTYTNNFDPADFGLHSWSVLWRCRKQKLSLHLVHWTGTSSFFLQPLNVHLLLNIFVLSDLQYWSMCCETVIFGEIPRGVGTGSEHKGQTGTWISFLWADLHSCFW